MAVTVTLVSVFLAFGVLSIIEFINRKNPFEKAHLSLYILVHGLSGIGLWNSLLDIIEIQSFLEYLFIESSISVISSLVFFFVYLNKKSQDHNLKK